MVQLVDQHGPEGRERSFEPVLLEAPEFLFGPGPEFLLGLVVGMQGPLLPVGIPDVYPDALVVR